jgi:nicotinate-nucleotide adenylyltransferase
VREELRLDHVLFVPNCKQPLKSNAPLASGDDRLRMVRAATAGNPAFGTSDLEIVRGGASYTIATLDELQRQNPLATLHFIMGIDAANEIASWREPFRIIAAYRPIVMHRAGWPPIDWEILDHVHKGAKQLITFVEVPPLEIASSELRARVASGRSIRYLVPDAVRDVIEDRGLYQLDE